MDGLMAWGATSFGPRRCPGINAELPLDIGRQMIKIAGSY